MSEANYISVTLLGTWGSNIFTWGQGNIVDRSNMIPTLCWYQSISSPLGSNDLNKHDNILILAFMAGWVNSSRLTDNKAITSRMDGRSCLSSFCGHWWGWNVWLIHILVYPWSGWKHRYKAVTLYWCDWWHYGRMDCPMIHILECPVCWHPDTGVQRSHGQCMMTH